VKYNEFYDVLMEQLIRAVNGYEYDPNYKDKVRVVVEAIENELSKQKQLRATDVNRHLEFDSNRYLRLLCRCGFLQTVPGGKEKRVYSRMETWPPTPDFLEGTPIGLAYYLQKWFRYNLQDWITRRMREVESKEGVYSLEGRHWFQNVPQLFNGLLSGNECVLIADHGGSYKDHSGETLPDDVCMIQNAAGISQMLLD
jgi:hypothetical protein